jgi:DMSO/TMAO reductase YedYZ molybdopterin-dependent catalytic subunit
MASETDRSRPLSGAVAGLLAGLVAVGVGQLVAGLGAQASAPIAAVGEAAIGLTPPAVKDFAISTFGTNDKRALLTGIIVLLGLFAIAIGVAGTRRLAYGLAGIGVFAAIGLSAAGTRPGANAGYFVPTIVAAAASGFVLVLLLRAIPARKQAGTGRAGAAQAGSAAAGDPRRAQAQASGVPGGDPRPGQAQAGSVPGGDPRPGQAQARQMAGDPLDWAPAAGRPPAAGMAAAGGGGRMPPSPPAASPPPGPPGESRRRFLVTGAAAVGTFAVGGLGGRVLAERGAVTQARASLKLPRPARMLADQLPAGTDFHIPGLSSFVTPNASFYRVDTALILPQVSPDNWRLRIHGMVEREIEVSFADLLRRPLIETYVTLTCVSNPVAGPYIGNARWLGASLASLLREARPRAGADQILSTSADGYTSGTPVQAVLDGRDALLAVAMNGQPLPVEHGFPARMVVPGLYGYVSATKWVTDLKLTTFAAETAYWAQRGWSQQAPIKTESRIDVPVSGATRPAGRTAVAGVAWAQHHGIDAVHVRVDRGPWQRATLAAVPGIDTWRQWVWYWDATPGTHLIEARATDDTGYTQTAATAQPPPNGASGYPAVQVTVR